MSRHGPAGFVRDTLAVARTPQVLKFLLEASAYAGVSQRILYRRFEFPEATEQPLHGGEGDSELVGL